MSDNRQILLVIDDDRATVRGISIRLQASGYNVISENNGENGLRCIQEKQPDAIVLDVCMPGMDGMEVLSQLRKTEQDQGGKPTPVIILSALPVDDEKLREMGASYIVSKPYDSARLLEVIESVMLESACRSYID